MIFKFFQHIRHGFFEFFTKFLCVIETEEQKKDLHQKTGRAVRLLSDLNWSVEAWHKMQRLKTSNGSPLPRVFLFILHLYLYLFCRSIT